jgi:hypothetical protein
MIDIIDGIVKINAVKVILWGVVLMIILEEINLNKLLNNMLILLAGCIFFLMRSGKLGNIWKMFKIRRFLMKKLEGMGIIKKYMGKEMYLLKKLSIIKNNHKNIFISFMNHFMIKMIIFLKM